MAVSSIQDRTNEFRSVLTQAQRKQASSKVGTQRQSLLTESQKAANGSVNGSANGDVKPRRSEFARRAAEIGRGIGATMGKLEKLAQCKIKSRNPVLGRTNLFFQWLKEKLCLMTGLSKLTS